MIRYVKGNIFNSQMETIVNQINCVGVMGKGLALEYKRRYPTLFYHINLHAQESLSFPAEYMCHVNRIKKYCSFPLKTTGRTLLNMNILIAASAILPKTTRT